MICLILARGGSKRIPRKNMAPFCGKPLFVWSVLQAKAAHLVDEIWVSTDDAEIADNAIANGAKVYMRPQITEDSVPGSVSAVEAIEAIAKETGREINEFLSLLPTSPLRLPHEIDNGIRLWRSDNYVEVVWGYCPKETTLWKFIEDGSAIPFLVNKNYGYSNGTARGDGIMTLRDYKICSTPVELDDVINYNDIYTKTLGKSFKLGIIKIYKWQVCDIDYPEDLEVAEYWMKNKILRDGNPYKMDNEPEMTEEEKLIRKYAGNINQL